MRTGVCVALMACAMFACGGDGVVQAPTTDVTMGSDAGPESPCDPACGPQGVCNGVSCLCNAGWTGPSCEDCLTDRFGADCAPCGCVHGTCADGVDGDGSCACDEGYTGTYCDFEDVPFVPWSDGPYDVGIMDTAGDFTVSTTEGPWTLSTEWTGVDSYLFIFKYAGSSYNTSVWGTDFSALFNRASPNTHFFFGSYDASYAADVATIEGQLAQALNAMSPEDQAHWAARTHIIDTQAFFLDGALASFIDANPMFWFAIDRLQRWREIGSLYDWGGNAMSRMSFIANETPMFDYEERIWREMGAMQGSEVVLMDKVVHGGGWGGGASTYLDITLPDASVMASADQMAIYIDMLCPDHLQEKENGCPEWDRAEELYLCNETTETEDAVVEACEPGATMPCGCVHPEGEAFEGTRTCEEDGARYGACACGCDREIARWITTYGREGRWLTDITPLLPLIQGGGDRRFRFAGNNGQELDLTLFVYDGGQADRPESLRYLWGRPWGTTFDETYNDGKHPDVTFEVPEGTSRVALYALISGHGSGTTAENCAEFCNAQHIFTINGQQIVEQNPEASTWTGCLDALDQGVVANQFGSWPYGRAGWCPGMDVKPRVHDITAMLEAGENTITYQGLYNGADYVPTPSGSGDYWPEMKMSSWLVFYGAKGE